MAVPGEFNVKSGGAAIVTERKGKEAVTCPGAMVRQKSAPWHLLSAWLSGQFSTKELKELQVSGDGLVMITCS